VRESIDHFQKIRNSVDNYENVIHAYERPHPVRRRGEANMGKFCVFNIQNLLETFKLVVLNVRSSYMSPSLKTEV
jgi:hypothetical protein